MPPGFPVGHESAGGSGGLALEKGGGILIDHLFHRRAETEMSVAGAGSGDMGAVHTGAVTSESEIFGVALAESLDQSQFGKTVAVGDAQRAHALVEIGHAGHREFCHGFRKIVLFVPVEIFEFNAVDLPELAVRTVGNVDGRKCPAPFDRDDGSHGTGEIEFDAAEAFKKVVNTVDSAPLHETFTESPGGSFIVADDDDVAFEGFDEESVTVKFGKVDTGGFGSFDIPNDKSGHFARGGGQDLQFGSGDLAHEISQLLSGKTGDGSGAPGGDDLKGGFAVFDQSDLSFFSDLVIPGTHRLGSECFHCSKAAQC